MQSPLRCVRDRPDQAHGRSTSQSQPGNLIRLLRRIDSCITQLNPHGRREEDHRDHVGFLQISHMDLRQMRSGLLRRQSHTVISPPPSPPLSLVHTHTLSLSHSLTLSRSYSLSHASPTRSSPAQTLRKRPTHRVYKYTKKGKKPR